MCEVIILTGHERFELAREAIALGVKQYLLKPVTGQTAFNRTAQSQPGNSRADEVKGLGRYCEEKAS